MGYALGSQEQKSECGRGSCAERKLSSVSRLRSLSDNESNDNLEAQPVPIKIYGLGGFCTYNRVLLCMVGLPARGKSYIVNMLTRYLRWTGFPVQTFNAGNLRRQEGLAGADANFFGDDKSASKKREDLASQTMNAALSWLEAQQDVSVAIFDATNTTKKRRRTIVERCAEVTGVTPVFVESICDDLAVLEQNYRLKLGNDDYKNMDPVQAREDFLRRVDMYAQRYETIDDGEPGSDDSGIRYIKLFNVGQKVVLRHCDGYAPSHIGFYLSNIHITPRRIWLVRHAETKDQQRGILGSVSDKLTRQGVRYCRSLARYIQGVQREIEDGHGQQILILMGTAPVHQATYDAITGSGNYCLTKEEKGLKSDVDFAKRCPAMNTSLLNELDGGDCNGMTYDKIKSDFPEVWEARESDKLNFRYPGAGGESYVDAPSL
eukprot:TRINITY_DN35904_c0_g1_i1.p1 TRINITY_DN35904_c0_g1~~TRINITY_DN35904_c0_g1_i1.p1  ORF type:complete len:457 (+),score=87.58 TRINITY_DN35904_c0_g1_i1:75-1373(+)